MHTIPENNSMAYWYCPECSTKVSRYGFFCPHCHFKYRTKNEFLAYQDPDRDRYHKINNRENYESIAGIIGVISIIIIIGASARTCISSGDDTPIDYPSSQSSKNDAILAYIIAMDFVKKELISPRTAKFPGVKERQEHTFDLGEETFQIVSWVDSENAYGTMIRQHFTCQIKFKEAVAYCKELILF